MRGGDESSDYKIGGEIFLLRVRNVYEGLVSCPE